MHKIYLVGQEKGGVGKTTISFNLAVLLAKAGHPVLLVDVDRQASSSIWTSMRTDAGHEPHLVCVQKEGKIGVDLLQLKQNYILIVDAGGADSVELRQAIAVCDKWIIPVRTGQLDLFSMAKMTQLLEDVKERVGRSPETLIVLNAVAPNTNEASEARELLADNATMTVMQAQLGDRVANRRAVMMGCGITELTGKAANETASREILALYEEVFGEPFHAAEKQV